MRIRFLKTWRMYQRGEVASFDDDLAAQIVAGGFGVEDGDAEAEPKTVTEDAVEAPPEATAPAAPEVQPEATATESDVPAEAAAATEAAPEAQAEATGGKRQK